jgi:hypothetical protein
MSSSPQSVGTVDVEHSHYYIITPHGEHHVPETQTVPGMRESAISTWTIIILGLVYIRVPCWDSLAVLVDQSVRTSSPSFLKDVSQVAIFSLHRVIYGSSTEAVALVACKSSSSSRCLFPARRALSNPALARSTGHRLAIRPHSFFNQATRTELAATYSDPS